MLVGADAPQHGGLDEAELDLRSRNAVHKESGRGSAQDDQQNSCNLVQRGAPLTSPAPLILTQPLRRKVRRPFARPLPTCLAAKRCWDQVRWAIEAYAWRFDGCAKPSQPRRS